MVTEPVLLSSAAGHSSGCDWTLMLLVYNRTKFTLQCNMAIRTFLDIRKTQTDTHTHHKNLKNAMGKGDGGGED